MKFFLLALPFLLFSLNGRAQTTWQVCVEDPPSTTCAGKTGTFTPGNLTIQQGDMIQFTTTMVLLGGYSGTNHDIQFSGSPANNVLLLVSADLFNQVTTVTTPPFNTPGVFPMECTNFNHCVLAEYSCTGYSVTVQAACSVTASFTTSALSVCTGDIVNFTNTSTGASTYNWHLDEFTFSTSTDAVLSFGTPGSYEVELIADDGAGCLDSTTVTVVVDQAVDAGTDDSLGLCNINDSIDLNTLVTGSTGGAWSETTSSGQFNNTTGVFNFNALTPADYKFNYVLLGTGACPNDTAKFIITANQEPNLILSLGTTSFDVLDSLYINFTTSGVLPAATYLWNFCDGNLATNTSPFYNSWSSVGDYCVCVQVNNGNNCVETFCDSTIVVYDALEISEKNELDVKIYPNPSNGVFSIDLSKILTRVEITIFDASQKIVYRQTTEGGINYVMNTAEFAKGTYYISIESGSNKSIIPVIFN